MYKLSELKRRYQEKLVTAEEAVQNVRSGDRVHYGLFGGIVRELDQAACAEGRRAFRCHSLCHHMGKRIYSRYYTGRSWGRTFSLLQHSFQYA